MSEKRTTLTYDITMPFLLVFITLGAVCNISSPQSNLLYSLAMGAGYGIVICLSVFILSFIPIVGQLILWFLVMPWLKSVFSISGANIFLFDYISLAFSIYYTILAIFIYSALASEGTGKYIR
jgi:hypothetical protein